MPSVASRNFQNMPSTRLSEMAAAGRTSGGVWRPHGQIIRFSQIAIVSTTGTMSSVVHRIHAIRMKATLMIK